MLVPGRLTPASQGAGRGLWLVCGAGFSFDTDVEYEFDAGVLSDATKSVSRAYINNFQDKGKQTAIDMFLVRTVPRLT
jgi:hypothetical protein